MSNAIDFISSYNAVDARLRALYRGKGNLQFSDLVRRCAEFNPTVKKYEDDLLMFAKLRNAIVHDSSRDRIIAEPCDDVTRLFAHIEALLCSPPKLSVLKEKRVTGISAEASVAEAVSKISESDFSNLPVYRKGRMIGMINNRRLVRVLGRALDRGESVEEVLSAPCSSILMEEDLTRFYKILAKDDSVQDAVDAFTENRKLLAVLVTETGAVGEHILNLITSTDLPRLLELLEA